MSNKALKQRKPKKGQTPRRPRISLVGLVLGISTLIGVPASVVTFWPHLNVSISDPVDPSNPFSASVTIAITGNLPLDLVEPFFGLRMMEFGVPGKPVELPADSPNLYTEFGNPKWHPGPNLGPDQKFTFGLNEIWGIQPTLSSADVAIIVRYEIPIVHLKREETFPLVAVRQTNNKIYWYPKAL